MVDTERPRATGWNRRAFRTTVRLAGRRVVNSLGYDLVKLRGPAVRYDSFVSVCEAYEQSLREAGIPIMPDATRVELLGRLLSTAPSEAYFLLRALVRTRDIEGDVCEFGVGRGSTSALIANEIAPTRRRLHLFDSFQGLSAPTEQDTLKDDIFSLGSMQAYTGATSHPESAVRARLDALRFPRDRYVIHKGFIDSVLRRDTRLPQRVSFAYLDFDLYEPTRIALDFLHGVTRRGAMFVVDDYDFFSTGLKKAVDEFVARHTGGQQGYELEVPDTRYGHFALLTRLRD